MGTLHGSLTATAQSPRLRPALLPGSRWARAALLLLVLFALLRSVLWASVQPAWLAPDEDYHWLYINYLVEKHTVPNLQGPFYTAEIYKGALLTQQSIYLLGPRTVYTGGPHAVLTKIGGSMSEREPAPPKPRPVLHPPLYHLGGAVVDLLLWHKVSVTRLTGIRYYSAALGALMIFFAWLLAAQVFAREWQQLAVAAIAATQAILAFSASTVSNDVGVAVTLTATLAWCAWILRGPPHSRQGIGLGVLLALALFTKATTGSLVIVIAAMLWLMWRTYPGAKREIVGIAKWTVAIPVVLVGWWYVYLVMKTHSLLGEEGSLTSSVGHGPGILHAPSIIWNWLSLVYRSYWFDYLAYEVRNTDIWFWLPLIGVGIVAAGFITLVVRERKTLTDPMSPELRQVLVLAIMAVVLLLPPIALDTLRGVKGLPFVSEQGRFLTPAYPGLAVIAVLALRELVGRRPRAFAIAVAGAVAAAFINYWHTWIVWVLQRFYGAIHGHWLRALYHASFDKPTFITQWSLAAIWLAGLAAFLLAAAITVRGAWPRAGSAQEREHGTPVDAQDAGQQRLASGAAEVG